MKKLMLLSSMLLFMTSCSDDDNIDTQNTAAISGYKITTISNYDDPAYNDYKRIITGNLSNGKLFSITTEFFTNNALISSETVQRYFYTNNLLTHIVLGGNYGDDYFYDSQNRFVGATRLYDDASTMYYRFVHQNATTVYCERTNLPYNDPTAVASSRMILNFDQEDNVTSAGFDNNFDGTPDNLYTYTYLNGNLTSMQKPDGTVINYNYENVIDSYYVLAENSYGKKVLRIICSESYCGGSIDYLDNNLNETPQDVSEFTYQTLPNNFYNKKTKIETLTSPTGVHTTETEFFFN